MSSDSEEDYMSMDFSAAAENDVRPGLLRSSQQKRELELLKRKQEFDSKFKTSKKKNLKVLEEEHREEGLRKPIEENNKGFALLAKMGYKPGGGIGKTEEKQNKPTALININVKTSRKGLGLPEHKPRATLKANTNAKPAESTLLSSSGLSDFRSNLAAKQRDKRLQADLVRSQKCCASLDKQEGKAQPWKAWFWPESELNDDLEDDDFQEYADVDDRFNGINERLNDDDESSIAQDESSEVFEKRTVTKDVRNQSCNERSIDSTKLSDTDCDDGVEDITSNECENTLKPKPYQDNTDDYNEENEDLSVAEKLDRLTQYLRTTYFYCIWCGHEFRDKADLSEHCPGPSSEDH